MVAREPSTDGRTLLTDKREGVLTLTLNRASRSNAVDDVLALAMLEALIAADQDKDIRVIRLGGRGAAFCSGRDFEVPAGETDPRLWHAVGREISRGSKPVLVVAHGLVAGVGLDWMLNADVTLAATDARFQLHERASAAPMAGNLDARMPTIAGLPRDLASLLIRGPITAAQALAWGLIWKVVDRRQLERVSWEMACRLAVSRSLT